ncbi:hypothetical protein [Actinoplanes sichuanensis]|uniref:Protein glutaminase domain-containing protein n=1 Tax=Actinoplanes sichuanensis TaxID=512349 RepID=A0ABW4AAJ9_9ACTN|nr:hypothetical protein [Actinoplanes sichuanensis]
MWRPFSERTGLGEDAAMVDVVAAVHAMPYARPSERTPLGALTEWRGTCSTKHALLAAVIGQRWPYTRPQLIHRVYRCMPADAVRDFGTAVAAAVPADGLWDVHRYLVVHLDGRPVVIDVTFPHGPAWDGRGSVPVACAAGTDHVAGPDPDADKRALEQAHCDPVVREPFIAALSVAA